MPIYCTLKVMMNPLDTKYKQVNLLLTVMKIVTLAPIKLFNEYLVTLFYSIAKFLNWII